MNHIPQITTDCLCLRGFRPDDAEDVYQYDSDHAVLLHTTGETPGSVGDSRKFVDDLLNSAPGDYAWAIQLKNEPRVIGAVKLGLGDSPDGSLLRTRKGILEQGIDDGSLPSRSGLRILFPSRHSDCHDDGRHRKPDVHSGHGKVRHRVPDNR